MRKKLLISIILFSVLSVALNATVFATVNGEDVIDADIQVLMRAMPGAKFEDLPADKKQKIVEQAVERKLLTAKAGKSGIEKDNDYLEFLKKQNESDFTPKEWMKIKGDLALEMWMRKIYHGIKVDAKDVKDYYDKNADKFMQPATVKARHVLVKSDEEAKEVIKQMSGLSGQALADKFAELATIKSAGVEGRGGGDLGWFGADQIVKPFADAAFALKKGEMTKAPVQTEFGFHIILVEDKKDAEAEKAKFDDVKVEIEKSLKMEKFRIQVSEKAKKLIQSTTVIYSPNYNPKAFQPSPIK